MANISDIYDGLNTIVAANTTDYIQLPDAYLLTENDMMSLTKGYSLGFGSGVNTERQYGCPQISISREFILVFTKLYTANEVDASARGTLEKQLMEDAGAVWKALDVINSISTDTVPITVTCKYTGDNGIQFLGDGQQFISIVSTVVVEYFQ